MTNSNRIAAAAYAGHVDLQKHDDWAQRWNAERLVVGVEDVLHCWDQDSGRAAGKLDDLLRAATSQAVVFLEAAYRGRRHSLASRLGNDSGALVSLSA